MKCQHHRGLEERGFHLVKNSYPLTTIKLPILSIFRKNRTCEFTKPGSITDAKHTVGSFFCLSPRYLQTHQHTQSNYIAAPTFSKLILPSPRLGTQPQCTSKDHTRNVLMLLSHITLTQSTSENKIIRYQSGLECACMLRVWTTCS